jgi:phosphate uptake regulator
MIVQEGIEENLRFLVLEVRKQVEKCRRFLASPSRNLLDSLQSKDDYIDNLKSIIQRKCFKHAIRDARIPKPEIDLLKAFETTAVNLERIADFCENISAQANYVVESGILNDYDFDPMFNIVLGALDRVEDALFQQDVQTALQVCRAEEDLDRHYGRAFQQCIDDMRGGADPSEVVTVIFIFRYLERMGDSLLNIGEAVISASMGERIKIDRFWALEDTLDASNLQDLKHSMRSVALQPIGETRSGCRISRVQSNKGGRPVIFKEGRLGKLEDERRSIEKWHEIMPGLAPQVHSFHHHEDSGSILFEFLPGETFDQVVIGREMATVQNALRETCTVLREIWTRTRTEPGNPAGYMKQLRNRLPDVYQLHPHFQQDSWGMAGMRFAGMEELIDRAEELESRHLKPPFSVYIHGDFNIDNIIYHAEAGAVHFIDLHRSRHTDYVQDVSVFMVSNQRLQVFEDRIRERLNHVAASFFEFARSYADSVGDTTFRARLALGLARSYATSGRFVLDEDFARRMFLKARFLLEQLLDHPQDKLDTFRIPEEVLID